MAEFKPFQHLYSSIKEIDPRYHEAFDRISDYLKQLLVPTSNAVAFEAISTGNVILTNVMQDVPGVRLELTPGTWIINVAVDFDILDSDQTGAQLVVDGTIQPQFLVLQTGLPVGVLARQVVSRNWLITTSVASAVAKVQVQDTRNDGTGVAHFPATNMTAVKIN